MPENTSSDPPIGGRYAKYVLFVLVLVYVFNFIDRQILSILAEEIKADIGISDAEIGFLYGTAFAVFYAIFGIPLGRLADVWVRKNLISAGLLFWSVMTALSGSARSFGSLAAFRFGVGVGESSATPAAFSMLSDYFSPNVRATALSVYSSGIYIGAGIGTFLGGMIVDGWNGAYPNIATAPLGIKAWQAAFLVVGLPGIVLALWVRTLKEPTRGQSEGITTETHPHPFKAAFEELVSVLPPLTLYNLLRIGGIRALGWNLLFLSIIAGVGYQLIEITGNIAQWAALGIGVYAAASWVQNVRIRDYPTYCMIFQCKTMICLCWGMPCIAFVTYGIGFWGAPYMIRVHDLSASEVGTFLGLGAALGGWIGVTLGGVLSDLFKQRAVNGRLIIILVAPILASPFAYVFVTTEDVVTAYVCSFFFSLFAPMWTGPAATTLNDLLLPRMRALSSAFYIMMITFIGLALGPYLIGYVSDFIGASGTESGRALQQAMTYALGMLGIATLFTIAALRFLPGDEASRLDRARAAGEVDGLGDQG
ncbi:MAG: MFS transporter [Myxococcales bacterium]|nr:MFS transporter [Myxococcales bacterium]HIK86795.1 MFS transporter [Myxococcales bacterium]